MDRTVPSPRTWRVLLIGGRSGLGKSTLAAELALRHGACCLQADDVRMALQSVTTPEAQPALHYFVAAPGVARSGVWRRPPEALCRGLIGVAGVVSEALAVVVSHHLVHAGPLVLDGDGILPTLAARAEFAAARADGTLQALCLIDPEDAAPDAGTEPALDADADQRTRLAMHRRYGCWLQDEAARLGLPALPARPYPTLLERAEALLAGGGRPT